MDILLKVSIILVVGFIGGKLAKLIKLPNVSGYLVAGLLLGPSLFNFVNMDDVNAFSVISELALAVIAFSIGSEFVIKEMKKVGKAIAIITLAEVIGAVFIVFGVMYYIVKMPLPFSLVIASMSAATAPAATLLVIRQYRADGPLTKTILPVVALDDVYGIMVFGIAISVAKLLLTGGNLSPIEMISKPLIEIVGSLILGLLFGFVLTFVRRILEGRDEKQIVSLAFIGVATGVSNALGLSPLLTNIVMGTVIANTLKNPKGIFDAINDFASPLFVMFFTLAGASLDINILYSIGVVGIAYILARGIGKYLGAWVGAKMVNSKKQVRRYLGLALLPQGGISIGLSVIVRQQLPEYAQLITTIIMFGVLIYEVTGPIFAKIAISKAKEINGLDKVEVEEEEIESEMTHLEPVMDNT
jgi:Kef-type K+ transport system membrane component KefB